MKYLKLFENFDIKKIFNIIAYMYDKKYKDIHYWFYIYKKFDNAEEEIDFHISMSQVKNIVNSFSDILENEFGINIIANTTYYNNDIRKKDIESYGFVIDDDIKLDTDFIIDLMNNEYTKKWEKDFNCKIVGIKKMSIYNKNSKNIIKYDSKEIENSAEEEYFSPKIIDFKEIETVL